MTGLDNSSASLTDRLRRYLQQSRESLVASLDGVSEYDVRRPVMPSGTNLLGLVKHLAGLEFMYLGDCVGRPAPVTLPWVEDESIWDDADLWATADQSRAELLELYREAWRHSDRTLEELPLDAPAKVAWWPAHRRDTTLGELVIRMVAETAQHAGHADILRETIDGKAAFTTVSDRGEQYWTAHVARVQAAADTYR